MAVELEAAFLLIFYERLIMLREDLAKKTSCQWLWKVETDVQNLKYLTKKQSFLMIMY